MGENHLDKHTTVVLVVLTLAIIAFITLCIVVGPEIVNQLENTHG